MNFGIPYMGSKNKIAVEIINELPPGKRFVDLFGGGFAMSHAALLSGKYDLIFYNDKNGQVVDLVHRAISGEFNYNRFKPEFIDRGRYDAEKETDPYIKYVWSFGNNGQNYMFGRTHDGVAELAKKQGHDFCVFGNPIDGVDFQCDSDDPIERMEALNQFAKKEAAKMKQDKEFVELFKRYQAINSAKALSVEFALEFTSWLRSTGITRREVDDLTGSCMSSHYLAAKNQPAIPTLEMWKKLKKGKTLSKVEIPERIEKLIDPDYLEQLERLQQLERLEQLERLQQLERLERLEQLERLQQLERLERLERLQHLQQLERLEFSSIDYRDYRYKKGDVVYCDPPYKDTEGYGEAFDHDAFYEWVRSAPFPVYFSEVCDLDFFVAWEKQKRSTYGPGNKHIMYERLYTNEKPMELLGYIMR